MNEQRTKEETKKQRTKEETKNYTIREFQLVVRDKPLIPIEVLPFVGKTLNSSQVVFDAFKDIKCMPVEVAIVLHLNMKNKIEGMTTVSMGTMNTSLVFPREVFRCAVQQLCCGLILIHNHPSGNPNPSHEDISITQRLLTAGGIIGIQLIDHIIIGSGSPPYFSFCDAGLIKAGKWNAK